jgi:hypothetical protein
MQLHLTFALLYRPPDLFVFFVVLPLTPSGISRLLPSTVQDSLSHVLFFPLHLPGLAPVNPSGFLPLLTLQLYSLQLQPFALGLLLRCLVGCSPHTCMFSERPSPCP